MIAVPEEGHFLPVAFYDGRSIADNLAAHHDHVALHHRLGTEGDIAKHRNDFSAPGAIHIDIAEDRDRFPAGRAVHSGVAQDRNRRTFDLTINGRRTQDGHRLENLAADRDRMVAERNLIGVLPTSLFRRHFDRDLLLCRGFGHAGTCRFVRL